MKLNISVSRGSKTLYHKTSTGALATILSENKFVLSPAPANESEQQFGQNEHYYLSMARLKTGSATLLDSHTSVMLVLDGERLGSRYKIRPVDYWGPEYRELGKNEMEDRLFTNKSEIPRAKSYIKEIHILINNDLMDDRYRKRLKPLFVSLIKSKIPFYVYTDRKAAGLLQKRKAVKPTEIDLVVKDKDILRQPTYYRHDRRYLKPYYQLLVMPISAKLDESQKRIVDQAWRYAHDFNPSFGNELHNAKNDKTTANHKYIAKILGQMRKHKLKGVDDVRQYIVEKWKDHL